MSEGMISIKKAVPIIVITWVLSLVTTLALVYVAPSIFPPLNTANISDTAIVADKIADGAIITTKLADGTVTSAKILDGTITATDLADGSIVTLKIANGAVTASKIADGAVTSAKVADSAIITVKLANESVTSEKIADGNVTTSDLDDDAIVTVKLADGAVTSAKILDGTITTEDIATGAINTVKIADGAITTAKIANYAVTNLKLAAGAIPFNATYSNSPTSTTSTSWGDLPAMSVGITLARNSNVIIMFSAEAYMGAPGDYLLVRALVNSTVASPGTGALITLTRVTVDNVGSYSFIFYLTDVTAGFYTVKMQWRSFTGTSGSVDSRTLTVLALPS
jgi:molybdopterin-binding protein